MRNPSPGFPTARQSAVLFGLPLELLGHLRISPFTEGDPGTPSPSPPPPFQKGGRNLYVSMWETYFFRKSLMYNAPAAGVLTILHNGVPAAIVPRCRYRKSRCVPRFSSPETGPAR